MTSLLRTLSAKPWLWSFLGALVLWLVTVAFTGGQGGGGMLTAALALSACASGRSAGQGGQNAASSAAAGDAAPMRAVRRSISGVGRIADLSGRFGVGGRRQLKRFVDGYHGRSLAWTP